MTFAAVYTKTLIAHRRALHQIAESGFNEWQTLNYLTRCTKDLEGARLHFINAAEAARIEKRSGLPLHDFLPSDAVKHFVLGEEIVIPSLCVSFKLGVEGKVIALRADIDALSIAESHDKGHSPADLSFVSATSCTHACAHDGHMAVLLTLAALIPQYREQLRQSGIKELRFIFQSAEEGCQGARFIRHASFMEGIDAIYCFHLGMGLPSKVIAPKVSKFLPTLKFNLSFLGRKAHAGHPQLGCNALQGMCRFIVKALAAMRPEAGRLINFGNLKAPGARNVIPDEASVEGEIRALSQAQLKAFEEEISHMIDEELAAIPGLAYRFKVTGFATEIKSDAALIAQVQGAAAHAGLKCAPEFAFSASEDASLLIDKVQESGGLGIYYVVGADLKAPHHHSAFDFDEGALTDALNVLAYVLKLA